MDIKQRLTCKNVFTLPLPEGKTQVCYWASEPQGFGLLVGRQSRTFVAQLGRRNHKRRVALVRAVPGKEPTANNPSNYDEALDLFDIEEAKPISEQVPRAKNGTAVTLPVIQPAAPSASMTLRDAFHLFEREMKRKRDPSTINDYRKRLGIDPPTPGRYDGGYARGLLDLPLAQIDRRAIKALHAKIADMIAERRPSGTGHASANATLRTISAVWNYALKEGETEHPNPCLRIEKLAEQARERHLTRAEMPVWWQAAVALKSTAPITSAYVRAALMTGMRRQALASIRWSDWDRVEQIIHVDRESMKGRTGRRKPYQLFVTAQFEAILHEVEAFGHDLSGVIFPAVGRPHGIVSPDWALRKIRAATGIEGISMHPLRHSYFSVAASQPEVTRPVRIKLMAHTSGDITDRYEHSEREERRAAALLIAAEIERRCHPTPTLRLVEAA